MVILLLLAALDSSSVMRVAVAPSESLTVLATPASTTSVRAAGAPVVLLPGLLGGTFAFRKVTPDLAADGHATYAIEPLGVGSSSHPKRGDYSLDSQADRIAAVLDTLGVRGAVIVGSNFGASVALRVAYRHPQLVVGVVLLDGGPVDRSSAGRASIALRLAPVLTFFGARGIARRRIAEALREYSANPSWVTAEVIDAYATPIVNDLGSAATVLSAMRRAAVDVPLADNLSRISQPVRLLIGATNRHGGIDSAETELLRQRLTDFAVDSVGNSGAYLHEERPDEVVRATLSLTHVLRHAVAISGSGDIVH